MKLGKTRAKRLVGNTANTSLPSSHLSTQSRGTYNGPGTVLETQARGALVVKGPGSAVRPGAHTG